MMEEEKNRQNKPGEDAKDKAKSAANREEQRREDKDREEQFEREPKQQQDKNS